MEKPPNIIEEDVFLVEFQYVTTALQSKVCIRANLGIAFVRNVVLTSKLLERNHWIDLSESSLFGDLYLLFVQ